MGSNLFSKNAMENLSTPEKLDEQVKIISPGAWIMFVTVIVGFVGFIIWFFVGTISNGEDYRGVIFDNNNVLRLTAKESGLLQDVLVSEGDHISAGDMIAVIVNDSLVAEIDQLRQEQRGLDPGSAEYAVLENRIVNCNNRMILRSTTDGMVQRIELSDGYAEAGATIATIVPESAYSYKEVYVYVPTDEAGAFTVGMEAQITPSYVAREEYGYMEGVVSAISPNIVTENYILKRMGTMDYVETVLPSSNCVEITIQLSVDSQGDGGYVWSNIKGRNLSVHSGDQCSVRILKQEYHPYELIWN